ncbi:MAG: ATP-binding protein [Nitrosopumilus sp.]|nr:ATP-binding protein [Nitrosopumilus sp.]MDH3488296.1 ATP-binding protein [Nitrosopumilus sp.]
MANNQPYKGKIVINSSIIQEVSKYPKALDAVREYICNGWDADADRIEITITSEFLRIEDWGSGISNFELFWGVADQHKSEIEHTPKFKRNPIGRKGLGKLSFFMLGENMDVETRTGHTAAYSVANFANDDFEVYPRENIDEVLSHRGTQITIRGLKNLVTKEELIPYIKENLYGLILPIASKDHPVKIFVNGEKVNPAPFSGTLGIISTLHGDIICNLIPSKTAKIDALFRGVKVREVNPAPTHPAKGYFNVNWLIPTLDRSNFTESQESRTFFPMIKKYILQNIPAKNEDSPKDLKKSVSDLMKMFEQILKDREIMPENIMPVTKTSKPTDLKMEGIVARDNSSEHEESKEKHDSKEERKPRHNKILKGSEKPLRSAYGIIYDFEKLGKDKPAIVAYKEEKLIIINLDHDKVKNLNKMRPIQRNIGLGQLISRGHFHILESFVNLNMYEEYLDEMDSALFTKMIS